MKSRSFSLFEASIKSQKTREVYVYSLHEFMKFAKIKKYDDILKFKPDDIQKLLENWVLHLKDNNKKGKTIKAKLCAVELFLEMNKITFYKKILHKLIPSNDYIPGGDIPFTTEESLNKVIFPQNYR
ncbi:MAG: site-specific integrase [Thaumarchaeota archaeon]|nr:site-specific integrase [Nitrososphaerota archaeon]